MEKIENANEISGGISSSESKKLKYGTDLVVIDDSGKLIARCMAKGVYVDPDWFRLIECQVVITEIYNNEKLNKIAERSVSVGQIVFLSRDYLDFADEWDKIERITPPSR